MSVSSRFNGNGTVSLSLSRSPSTEGSSPVGWGGFERRSDGLGQRRGFRGRGVYEGVPLQPRRSPLLYRLAEVSLEASRFEMLLFQESRRTVQYLSSGVAHSKLIKSPLC